jgi:exo-1,4-beta-D-glucosaminidase
MLLRTPMMNRLRDQFRLVRDMNLNSIRLEGKLETDEFFHLADQQGILVMLGWCCCDHWEHWKDWTPEDLTIATASLRAQMLRLRHHASLLVWLNGSDNPPIAERGERLPEGRVRDALAQPGAIFRHSTPPA